MAKFVAFENVAFNTDWMKTKTCEQFCEHEKHHNIPKEKMQEFYYMVTGTKPATEIKTSEKPNVIQAGSKEVKK